jgi:microcystin-dependent protein
MSDQFVAEIRIFPFNFPPTGWAFCDGQLLPISQNTALFALLGTAYGGDGKSTFGLPDLQGSAPLHVGGDQPGPGLSTYGLGQSGGSDTVTLLQSETPVHTHSVMAQTVDQGDNREPSPARNLGNTQMYSASAPAGSPTLDPSAVTIAGGGLPHNNLMPYLTLNFCVAMQGIFPQRP